ncbi:protein NUCLEAR FUSION DEFECTIVE 4-like [Andrographis paniculata]|uniref:protein NUCLEAR FUSION DEFECTIVE 4-like n=1 Tax=Andrographis paniculata TaxID=175694 RepID=UPI0021E78A2C|nr:protein NUCLEAR FUSION DEFECTIVE 4-like [Andrographis paniculata]
MALQWLSLVGAIWLQSISGSNSNFPAYSSELKRRLSISQLQLNNLASASDAGKLFGWLSGLAAAHLPLWLVLLIGSLLGSAGYGFQFLFLADLLPPPSYAAMFFLTAVAGNSICWINTVCYILVINNFPLDRHVAVGLSGSYVGLSAKLYADIVDAAVAPSAPPPDRAKAFLLVSALLPPAVCISAAPFARPVQVNPTRKLTRGFFAMFAVTIATGVLAVTTNLTAVLSPASVVAAMLAMLLVPLLVPLYENVRERIEQKCSIRIHNVNNMSAIEYGGKIEGCEIRDFEDCSSIEEIGAKAMLCRLDFWLYYFVYLFGATLGLVYLNNLGQIAESRGCFRTTWLVSLSSAFTFFGRLVPSLLDYLCSKTKVGKVSGGGAMGAIMVPICGAFFMLLNKHTMFLYTSTAIIGTCTGALSSIAVTTTTELFGVKNFGVNHNIVVSNIPIGTFLFGDLAALLYNKFASFEGKCMGQNCYQTTFIIWGSLCGLGIFLSLILHIRTKPHRLV